jgi:acyl-CoA thioester hydrolase
VTFKSRDEQSLDLEDFPFRTYDKVRYADTDRQGHVNNAAFSSYLETGRVEFLYDPQNSLLTENASFVIASLTLRFLSEVNWPGMIDIGTGVTKVGNSSLGLYQGLFQDGHCVATAETVIVQIDDRSRKSSQLTDDARAFLKQYELDLSQ